MNASRRIATHCFAAVATLTLACGSDDGDSGGDTASVDLIGSCQSTAKAICLDYTKLPTGSTKADIVALCDGDDVWSDAACPGEMSGPRFGACDVTASGGEVTTFFYPPYSESSATERCTKSSGTYREL